MVQTTDASPSDVGVGHVAQAALDLETQGWAVVPDVLSTIECEEYVNGAWTWLESLDTGIKRSDPATWGDDRWPSSFRGIINTLEVSHQDFVWRVRQNPRILQVGEAWLVFCSIWQSSFCLPLLEQIIHCCCCFMVAFSSWIMLSYPCQ